MLTIMGAVLFAGLLTAALCWSVLSEREESARHAEMEQIDREYREAVDSQGPGRPQGVGYETVPCPHCGHYRVRPIDPSGGGLPAASGDAASEPTGKPFLCEHCGKTWRQSK